MGKGLFTSIYGKSEEGIFGSGLFSRHGSTPTYTSADIRLGDFHQAEDEEDDEETPAEPAPAPTASGSAAPQADRPTMNVTKESLFAKQIAGFPLWLLGVTFLGFSWALRKRRSKA